MNTTEFMLQLAHNLVTERKITESSANAYVKVLYAVNDKKPFKNLTFLKAVDTIMERVGHYAESTQRAILASIVSVLTAQKDKPTFKKAYTHYYEEMMKRSKAAREEDSKNEKTEVQKKNWVEWSVVEEKRNQLYEEVARMASKKVLAASEYEKLLMLVVLALYTEIQPRRNQDYLDMYIVKKWKEDMPADKNYLDISTKRFIFHRYKTSKKYGTQIEEIPERLWERLSLYLKHHPVWKGAAKRGTTPIKLLVTHDGSPIVAKNAITRILNKVFGKRIGSSMLRHIFLSSKYGNTLEEMKKDSDAMGHSLGVQKSYIKKDDAPAEMTGNGPYLEISPNVEQQSAPPS